MHLYISALFTALLLPWVGKLILIARANNSKTKFNPGPRIRSREGLGGKRGPKRH